VSVLEAFSGCVLERQGTPRPFIPEPLRLIGQPLWLLTKRQWSHSVACAAPPPSPALTGEFMRLSLAFAWDGMRARHYFSVAEDTRHAALQSPCTWRLNLNTCVVQPHRLAPEYRNHVRTPDRLLTAPAPGSGKKRKKPLSGVVCLLTNRGLIRVRPRTDARGL